MCCENCFIKNNTFRMWNEIFWGWPNTFDWYYLSIYLYIYIYIYIYCHLLIYRQICFVLSELISVARQARFPKLGSKPGWLKRQSKILPLNIYIYIYTKIFKQTTEGGYKQVVLLLCFISESIWIKINLTEDCIYGELNKI